MRWWLIRALFTTFLIFPWNIPDGAGLCSIQDLRARFSNPGSSYFLLRSPLKASGTLLSPHILSYGAFTPTLFLQAFQLVPTTLVGVKGPKQMRFQSRSNRTLIGFVCSVNALGCFGLSRQETYGEEEEKHFIVIWFNEEMKRLLMRGWARDWERMGDGGRTVSPEDEEAAAVGD